MSYDQKELLPKKYRIRLSFYSVYKKVEKKVRKLTYLRAFCPQLRVELFV